MDRTSTSAPTVVTPLPDRAGISDEEQRLARTFRERYADQVEGLIVRRAVEDPKVTLIVISFRAKEYLLECLRHLRGQTVALDVPYEILLADCGGLEDLRPHYGNLVDVDLRLRYGLPLNVARNAAMAHARGELVAFIDDDGLVSPTWVEEALAVFKDPKVGMVRGRIVPHEHRYLSAYAVHYDRGDEPWEEGNVSVEGNMMTRRQLYFAVDGFPDQAYGSEGLVIAYLVAKKFPEYKVMYTPGMVMRHDFCRSVREFVWKCRKYKDVRQVATQNDPGLREYLAAYLRRPKPVPKRTLGEKAALRILRAAEQMIVRVPLFDHVKRR